MAEASKQIDSHGGTPATKDLKTKAKKLVVVPPRESGNGLVTVEDEILARASLADQTPSRIDVGELSREARRKLMYPAG